jgi:hypothetical protein
MANYLASIFGTEQDKVNCSFYYKIGACRHGDRCSRKHVKPSYSQTILLPNLYQNPAYDPKNKMNPQQMQMHFDAFYEDIWWRSSSYATTTMIVSTALFSFLQLPTNTSVRSHRQRLRALQVRRRFAKSLRRAKLALVRRPPHLLRTLARHRFPRSLLSPEQRGGLCARRLLQLHTSQGTVG